jgi:hypothetical protein
MNIVASENELQTTQKDDLPRVTALDQVVFDVDEESKSPPSDPNADTPTDVNTGVEDEQKQNTGEQVAPKFANGLRFSDLIKESELELKTK